MNCPTCGRQVPPLALACEACTNRHNHENIKKSQRFFIKDAREDRIRYFAVRKRQDRPWHLALFGDRTHSYCGEEFLRPTYKNRTYLAWHYLEERPGEVCDKCLHQLHQYEEALAQMREEA